MGEKTGIAWTDHTRNFWSGCTKIGPGCNACYAEAFQRRFVGVNADTGEANNWGPGAPRTPHLEGAVKEIHRWDIKAKKAGVKRLVFINSQSDFFDNEVPNEWRSCAYDVFADCENLEFLLVTKRIGNVEKMVDPRWIESGFPDNVRLLITVCNQEEADRDIPKLLDLTRHAKCKNGLSMEPLLGPIDLAQACAKYRWRDPDGVECCALPRHIDWVIVGGESTQGAGKARTFDIAWARSTIEQCKAAGVAAFFKQAGSTPHIDGVQLKLKDRAGGDMAELPADVNVREFP